LRILAFSRKENPTGKSKIFAYNKAMPDFYQPNETLAIAPGVFRTKIDGLFYLEYPQFPDERGLFSEVLRPQIVQAHINPQFVIKQVNHSYSKTKVLRGMHAEGWNKLITVLAGTAYCAIADTRPESATFLQVEYFRLHFDPQAKVAANLYISKRLANSICALEGPVQYLYGVDLLYQERDPRDDQSISPFDPDLHLEWPFSRDEMIISERDQKSVLLKNLQERK
jgi:dTDP-4-dehydrorhamnose 3,5-epimerase-like enzyme